MSAQHTAGPWSYGVQSDDDNHACLATIYSVPTLPTKDGKGQRFGLISARKSYLAVTDEERLANALLMTAAPEMFEALRAAEAALASYATTHVGVHHDSLRAVRAAVAKAEGRS